jgi:DNA-directed RNA polymerase subunit RPC12/RpoP
MVAGGRRYEARAMNSELIGSRITRSWRRCTSCGRFFSFPQWGREPRDCQACGHARLVPSSPGLSFWRLLND